MYFIYVLYKLFNLVSNLTLAFSFSQPSAFAKKKIILKMSLRGSAYIPAEDQMLCQIYIDISQDPITGRNQSGKRFWSRVEKTYNESKQASWEQRTLRSLQSRMQTIEKATRKLNGCIRQVELLNPSGASEQDIVSSRNILCILIYIHNKNIYIHFSNSFAVRSSKNVVNGRSQLQTWFQV